MTGRTLRDLIEIVLDSTVGSLDEVNPAFERYMFLEPHEYNLPAATRARLQDEREKLASDKVWKDYLKRGSSPASAGVKTSAKREGVVVFYLIEQPSSTSRVDCVMIIHNNLADLGRYSDMLQKKLGSSWTYSAVEQKMDAGNPLGNYMTAFVISDPVSYSTIEALLEQFVSANKELGLMNGEDYEKA